MDAEGCSKYLTDVLKSGGWMADRNFTHVGKMFYGLNLDVKSMDVVMGDVCQYCADTGVKINKIEVKYDHAGVWVDLFHQ